MLLPQQVKALMTALQGPRPPVYDLVAEAPRPCVRDSLPDTCLPTHRACSPRRPWSPAHAQLLGWDWHVPVEHRDLRNSLEVLVAVPKGRQGREPPGPRYPDQRLLGIRTWITSVCTVYQAPAWHMALLRPQELVPAFWQHPWGGEMGKQRAGQCTEGSVR